MRSRLASLATQSLRLEWITGDPASPSLVPHIGSKNRQPEPKTALKNKKGTFQNHPEEKPWGMSRIQTIQLSALKTERQIQSPSGGFLRISSHVVRNGKETSRNHSQVSLSPCGCLQLEATVPLDHSPLP